MKNLKLLLIVSTCQCVFSYYSKSRQDFHVNNFINPVESYIGPSSYATSSYSTSNINDYPAVGNFGQLLNMNSPQITSSFSSYGPSENGELESTSYINYPPQITSIVHGESPIQSHHSPSTYFNPQNAISSSNFNLFNQQISPPTNLSFNPQIPQDFASLISSTFDNLSLNLPPPSSEVISEHIEVTKPIVVPVYKRFPYPQAKHFPVAIPHPVLVPYPAPYPVNVVVSEPVAVPVLKEIRIPVEKEFLYPVHKHIPVEVERPLKFRVEKHFPVYVPKPYPVKIPIIKTLIHKAPKKWSRNVNFDAQKKTFTMTKKLH